ncbi:dioxygenase [Cupriavidus necator]|uniref:Dioxygenase n=1 Tax=Cupriavidus necator TaxID=106590 RepID=A0A1U9UNY6_CUPNE|nr:VOC family protein [Cupriavidus necator]AQV94157.1 dioxygenase [Cupriavidus necator]
MIRSLQHVGITVPELEVGRAFYQAFGLLPHVQGNDLAFRCEGRQQDQIRLMSGPRKRLSYVSFGVGKGELENFTTRLEQHGVRVSDGPFARQLDGIWFQDPDGDWIHLCEADSQPTRIVTPPEINTPGEYRRIGKRGCGLESHARRVSPLRLGHLIKFSPDVDRQVDFYTRVLGMKVSDRAGSILAFLRSAGGGDHHIIAFARSSHTGLHHLSFEVGGLDEIELGARHLVEQGYRSAFGLGRHVAGSNYFHYIRDPWNSLCEYFWDIDVIPKDDADWEPWDATPEQVTAVWAVSPPPPDFVLNFEQP